jgi:hypothetical protein
MEATFFFFLREQAYRLRECASKCTDPLVAEQLRTMSAEFVEKAQLFEDILKRKRGR